MANTDDLVRFLKADMVRNGDLIHFCDAGSISDKDFKQEGVSKKSKVLEMEVMIGETMKRIIYSPNKITIDLLKNAWGKDTQTWVGETGMISIVEQIVFDKLKPVIVVKPLTNLDKATKIQAQLDRMQKTTSKAMPSPSNVWEEESVAGGEVKPGSLEDFQNTQIEGPKA